MCPLADNNTMRPRELINRVEEQALIQKAFDALLSRTGLLSTPLIGFFGIDGIGKTRMLQEISARCKENDLPCIELDGDQAISSISDAIVTQLKEYSQESLEETTVNEEISHVQIIGALRSFLDINALVILVDSIDASNIELVNWIKTTLHGLMEHNNLFVVLTSKQKIIFENDWSMARKLTSFQLKPLDLEHRIHYLKSIDDTTSPETKEIIFQWTRGYPLAMEVMTKEIRKNHFDMEKSEDQKQLITIIIQEVIDRKVLAHVEHSQLDWYKAHLRLLCIPRCFNLIIMQELLEQFGKPPIKKLGSKLEYMGLPKRLNLNMDILPWDNRKVGFTLNEAIRNIFLVYQQLHDFPLFLSANQYLANKNMDIATREVTGSDSIRYFREHLYHWAQSNDIQKSEAIFQLIPQKIIEALPDAIQQFYDEFTRDHELREVLGQNCCDIIDLVISQHLEDEEEQP
jgi:hypothetical protein